MPGVWWGIFIALVIIFIIIDLTVFYHASNKLTQLLPKGDTSGNISGTAPGKTQGTVEIIQKENK